MKIILCVNSLQSFLNHRMGLASEILKNTEHQLIVSIPHIDIQKAESLGLPYKFKGFHMSRRGINPFEELRTLMDLTTLHMNEKTDIVHNFTIKPVIYGTCAAQLAGTKRVVNSMTGLGYVFTEGGGIAKKILKRIVKSLYRFCLSSKNTYVIFQNPDDKELFLQEKISLANQSYLVPGSGVDQNKFYPIYSAKDSTNLKILFPSRMLWDKGIAELTEAKKILIQKDIDVDIFFAGSPDPGNPRSVTLEKLTKWHKDGLIHYLGLQENMNMVYNQMDIVCLPSFYREGIPMALLEGLACGKPIITTDMPGCREVVPEGKNGLLIPPRNAKALADALEEINKNRDKLQEMSTHSLSLASEFSREKITRMILTIYFQ